MASTRGEGPHVPFERQVNDTGYPFELAIERLIDTIPNRPWGVQREVPCGDRYIDVFARYKHIYVFIECKLAAGQNWIFLVEDRDPGGEHSLSNLPFCRFDFYSGPLSNLKMEGLLSCTTFTVARGSYVSDICTLKKKGVSGPTLENIAQELISAAQHVMGRPITGHHYTEEVIIPIIVTTANLVVCKYPSDKLNAETGEISPGSQYEEVEFIRFQKSLSTEDPFVMLGGRNKIDDLNRMMERTVFICRGRYLQTLLNAIVLKTEKIGGP